ncbi:cytochrome c oxidase assembly protein COX19 [Macrosteles quadrilineatus]|uniref:cytochrome c oxidase assembly protein COX19 n=1 Tax=Macrosteles quadrilineatus TaxID=74068 RepID=UPI0023E0D009|nr:cytochrome c oxidase assembly protein COX19 [Macrosteles quadrilineatus]XP_054274023.1 cytochrome c oxidase assembly protein COX19 [Macrosteles quadrilineatus]XP_054274032.1 cytochrome c oxidase assembly protein COX19 [Macrosteles quadrilineatus]XP_054274041.1 cytochrome c oxidase assembly protein COX19 [Macrosteles quadrilineatus]XP_054274050.1 cytochrome c oxidase assembly protein COX19 [Macrosteles quadrilineatus]
MSSFTFSNKVFTPSPPDKGSFPLDHEGQCKGVMLKYMFCLNDHRNNNSECREQIKAYLQCRMENNLMAKEDWAKLGLSDIELSNQGKVSGTD